MTEGHRLEPLDAHKDLVRVAAAGDVEFTPQRCARADKNSVIPFLEQRL